MKLFPHGKGRSKFTFLLPAPGDTRSWGDGQKLSPLVTKRVFPYKNEEFDSHGAHHDLAKGARHWHFENSADIMKISILNKELWQAGKSRSLVPFQRVREIVLLSGGHNLDALSYSVKNEENRDFDGTIDKRHGKCADMNPSLQYLQEYCRSKTRKRPLESMSP